MKRATFFILITLFITTISCGNINKKSDDSVISIKTEFGIIKIKLYDKTLEHKKNFIKLVDQGFYNDLLFHRVINNFMIQGGDPKSKNTQPGVRLGGGNVGYTIPSEFVTEYIHKKGALAAARQGGPSNPEKRSSGSQFYIVHGKIFTPGKLDTLEMMRNNKAKNELLKENFAKANVELRECRKNNNEEGFNALVVEIRENVDSTFEATPKFKFSDVQREIYTTIGGYPALDGDYTVFGEVIEGLDILDKIAAVETDKNNRPVNDIKMEIEIAK